MGRYFKASLLSSFPGFIIEAMLDFFHCFGKQPSLRHLLYTSVRKNGKLLKARRSISLVSPSSPGAFLGLNFFITDAISSREKGLSSCVYRLLYLLSNLLVNCTVICLIVFRKKKSNTCFVVLSVSKVKVLSDCWRVVKQVVLLNFLMRFYNLRSKGWTPQLRSSTFTRI